MHSRSLPAPTDPRDGAQPRSCLPPPCPTTSLFHTPTAGGGSVVRTGCSGISAPHSAAATMLVSPGWLQDWATPSTEHLPPGTTQSPREEGAWQGRPRRVPRRSSPRASTGSLCHRDGAVRADGTYGDFSSINRHSCAPALSLPRKQKKRHSEVVQSKWWRAGQSAGRAPSQPCAPSARWGAAQGAALGSVGTCPPLCRSPHSLSTPSPPKDHGLLLGGVQAAVGISPHPAPNREGTTGGPRPLPSRCSMTCCLFAGQLSWRDPKSQLRQAIRSTQTLFETELFNRNTTTGRVYPALFSTPTT